MQKKQNRDVVLNLCLFYIAYVFLYGIVIKLTIRNGFIFQLKTYVPEIVLGLIIIRCLFKGKVRMTRLGFALVAYLVIVFGVNFFLYGVNEQAMYLVRDIYIPLVAFIFLLSVKFNPEEVDSFYFWLSRFCKVYLVAGLALAIVEQIKGWEWTSIFYTGYSFYGQDPVSKVKIAHNLGLLRAPCLSGNFATFGYYCLISLVIIRSRENKTFKKLIWDIIAALCLILATNKSALVGFAVIILLGSTTAIRSGSKRLNRIIIVGIGVFLLLTTITLFGDDSDGTNFLTGIFARFDVWKDISSQVNMTELIFPYHQFTYGTGAEGGLGFWDNTYFYSLFTQGIFGSYLWFKVVKDKYQQQMKSGSPVVKLIIYDLTVLLLVLGLTVNVTQGRGFFSLYLLFLGVYSIPTPTNVR